MSERRRDWISNLGLAVVLAVGVLAELATSDAWRWPPKPQLIWSLLIGLTLVALSLSRPKAQSADTRWWVWVVCCLSMTYWVGYEDIPASGPLGEASIVLLIAGHVLADTCLLYLGRSFAVLPARRQVRTGWLYRWVRHPTYATYILVDSTFVAANPSLRNGVTLALGVALFILRSGLEEKVLLADPDYQAYSKRTRARFIPWLI